jgi:hypothetical protein
MLKGGSAMAKRRAREFYVIIEEGSRMLKHPAQQVEAR